MSTFQINAVRVARTSYDPHEHIVAVRVGNNLDLSLSTVVGDLRNPHGDRYITFGGGVRAAVYVRRCPRCTFRDYLTTHPDSTTKNNLLFLPRF